MKPGTPQDRLYRAVFRLRSVWTLLQALLIALGIASGALWLAIPDSNGKEIGLSALLAFLGALLFPWGQSRIFIVARRREPAPKAWPGALLLLALGVVYWLVTTFFDAGQLQDASRTLEWSPHLPGSGGGNLRVLMAAQRIVWDLLRLLTAALLLPFAMEGAAAGLRGTWLRRAAGVLRRPFFWFTAIGAVALTAVVTEGLLVLRPQLSPLPEALLAIAKVGVLFAVDVGALCLLISLTGTYLRDADRASREEPEALPSSGPRQRRRTRAAR